MLGGMGVAAVAKGYQRFVQKLEKDEEMKNKIAQIELEMSRVNGLLPKQGSAIPGIVIRNTDGVVLQ
jgi:hypothetical protein